MNAMVPFNDIASGFKLRLLSYNIQVGISAAGFRDYVLHGWKHILPCPQRLKNLHRIARVIRDFDVVGLQELDSGSLRSGFINHAEYLAREAEFPHWFDKTNRKLWKVARHSMGLLSKYAPISISRHDLPARVPGRGSDRLFRKSGRPPGAGPRAPFAEPKRQMLPDGVLERACQGL